MIVVKKDNSYVPQMVATIDTEIEAAAFNEVEISGRFLDYLDRVEITAPIMTGVSYEIDSYGYNFVLILLTANSHDQEYTFNFIPKKGQTVIVKKTSYK